MYTPRHFAFPDGALDALHDLIEAHNFGILVAAADDPAAPPEAVHMPFVLDRARGAHGTLIGHVARANPIWRRFAPGRPVLVVFQGPHTYISPDWYATRGLVPTWNYLAVHAYGTPSLLESEDAIRAALAALGATMEAGLAPKPPWTMDQVAESTLRSLIGAIVAFEIGIERLEGKRKLNQNRAPRDRAAVIAALEAQDTPDATAVARHMRILD